VTYIDSVEGDRGKDCTDRRSAGGLFGFKVYDSGDGKKFLRDIKDVCLGND